MYINYKVAYLCILAFAIHTNSTENIFQKNVFNQLEHNFLSCVVLITRIKSVRFYHTNAGTGIRTFLAADFSSINLKDQKILQITDTCNAT